MNNHKIELLKQKFNPFHFTFKNTLLLIVMLGFVWNAQSQIGLYDIQLIGGVNMTKPKKNLAGEGDFGTELDLGITFLAIPYGGKNHPGPSFVGELHVDYTRQNIESYLITTDLKFRRKEIYARIRPFSYNPLYTTDVTDAGSLLYYIVAGLYVDVGYSIGDYYFIDVFDKITIPDDQKNGFFWGYGMGLPLRNSRYGFVFGYGSKKYKFKSMAGDDIKYSSRSFYFGASYNIVWKGEDY